MREALRQNRNVVVIGLIGLGIFALLPLFGLSGFAYRTLTSMFLLIVTAQGWNLIGGYTGYAAFGNVAFFGLGAYATGILMYRHGWSFLPTMLIGGLVAAGYAALIGLPVLRLRGHYFAIATLGVAEATREIVAWWTPVTDGAAGISLPFLKPISLGQNFFYYLTLGMVIFGAFLTWFIIRRKLGYSWIAIRADEDAAKMLGINTTVSKVTAYALTAFLVGIAGSVYAYYNSFIAPEEVFKIDRTLQGILAVVLGGAGTIAGPIAGGVIFQLVSTFLIFSKPFGIDLGQFHVTIMGIFIVLVIIFTPRGVIDLVTRSAREARRAPADQPAGRRSTWAFLKDSARATRLILVQNRQQFKI